ncbi:MAG: O-antigen translocase [Bacteroidales bacterium]|nr:O-antigen translocase [Bacteroidales bacterium]MDD4669661.1 O-antigen translocase [Bacteroidales bacterium]
MGRIIDNIGQFVKKVFRQDIVKVFSFTSISTIVKMLTSFISMKVIAIVIGPSGVALLGQLSNFSSIAMTAASGGINNGITKYVAEFRQSDSKVKTLLSTALKITIICSLICGILMIAFNSFLSRTIMLANGYEYVFIIFGITILFYALNALLVSILNGYKDFKKYVTVNIVGSVVGLIFTLIFVFTLGLKGALISAVTFQSVIFVITLWMVRKLPWFKKSNFQEKIDRYTTKKYFGYALMTFATIITVPIAQLVLRSYVISNISIVEAGWWESMNKISSMYLMVITSSFSVYYLPRLSEIHDKLELKKEIFTAYKLIIPLIIVGFAAIYFLRFLIIRVLFTPDFLPMENLFIWQLAGDFFKISSWLLSFLMVAKSMTKSFIATEILFSALFVGLSFIFMKFNGVVGITQGYLVTYFIYMITMVILFKNTIFAHK